MPGLLNQEIVHQCRIGLTLLVMMGLYSLVTYRHAMSGPSLQTFEQQRTFARTSAVSGGTVSCGSASQHFQDVNSLMPFRWHHRSHSVLVLVSLLLGRLARVQAVKSVHRVYYARRRTSLCKALMIRIGILPHNHNFQRIYPSSHPDTGWKAPVFFVRILQRCSPATCTPAANPSE